MPADRIDALGPIDVLPVGSAISARMGHIDRGGGCRGGRIEVPRRQVTPCARSEQFANTLTSSLTPESCALDASCTLEIADIASFPVYAEIT